jgi:predicted AlkP superfamily pyrophosphatase or phosphodiesterase
VVTPESAPAPENPEGVDPEPPHAAMLVTAATNAHERGRAWIVVLIIALLSRAEEDVSTTTQHVLASHLTIDRNLRHFIEPLAFRSKVNLQGRGAKCSPTRMRFASTRIALAFVCVTMGACSGRAVRMPESAQPAAPAPRGPLVVSIVVDQLAAWVASERLPLLPKDGGFARLMREGTYVEDMRYAHAVTDTGPGHAALYTGATPRFSGIIANDLPRDINKVRDRVSIMRSERDHFINANGKLGGAGSSADMLIVDTVADRLRDGFHDAVIVSASLKDRSAIIPGGYHPSDTIWFDTKSDTFVTSAAFAERFPEWARSVADPAKWREGAWTPLDRAWIESHAATGDAQDGEGDLAGLGVVFPHSSSAAAKPGVAWRATPAADEALLAIGLAAIDAYGDANGEQPKSGDPTRVGDDDSGESVLAKRPTLIALSLSANDYVGHTFGPDSWEAWDELRRLDGALARFFDALDRKVGPNGYAVILSADHGTTTMPEAARLAAARPWCKTDNGAHDRWARACGNVGRVLLDPLDLELRAAAKRALGGDDDAWVVGVADPYVVLTREADALDPKRRTLLIDALTTTILAHAEIDRVINVQNLPSTCPPPEDDSVFALVCRSVCPGRGGALYMVTKRGSFFDPGVVVGKGTSHGTPYVYDRSVPLFVRAPGRVAAGRVISGPIPFGTFARTLASLLGSDPPSAASFAPDLTNASSLPITAPKAP